MSPSDKAATPTEDLEASISDLLDYDFEVVETDEDDGDLEAGCLSCS